jgi:hypothetical protein
MADSAPAKPNGKDERSETFGPIELTRHVKEDGRALILYTRRARPDADGERDT